MQRNLVSIIIPVYKNADTLERLHREVSAVLALMDVSSEFLFIDDASPDCSSDVLRALQAKHAGIKVMSNASNCGQQASIRTGLRACRGDSIVVMDADLQDPPTVVPQLLKHLWAGQYQAVFATRVGVYQSKFRMMCSICYRALMCRLARLPKGAGGFVALTRDLADQIAKSPNPRFYLAGLVGCHAIQVGAMPVPRAFRGSGTSSYTGRMRLWTAVSNILCVLKEKYVYAAT